MTIIVHMRNRYLSAQQQLGQYMTPPALAAAVARTLPRMLEPSVLEVGAGDGALLAAARSAARLGRVTAIELEPALASSLERAGYEVIVGDATKLATWKRIADRTFDVILGNPPYAVYKSPSLANHVVEWGLGDVVRGPRLDTLFIAESLARLRSGGAGAFVLPLPLLTDRVFSEFRRKLTERFACLQVIELPATAFPRAEVKTAICSFSGVATRGCKVTLAQGDVQGNVLDELSVSTAQAQHRADYSYHAGMQVIRKKIGLRARNLSEMGAEVVRGSTTAQRFAQLQVKCLHTTDFPEEGIGQLRYRRGSGHAFKVAQVGDIVVPRLGSRCLLRQAIVVSGSSPYTESVYRVRVPSQHRNAVLDCLAGEVGETWREIHAKGSCAKHLTVADLLNMPVPV